MKVVAETLGVARSNLVDRLKGKTKLRRRYHKAQDAELVPRIATLVTSRPTYGYRRITAILNRQLRSESLAPVNHKSICLEAQGKKSCNEPDRTGDLRVSEVRSGGVDERDVAPQQNLFDRHIMIQRLQRLLRCREGRSAIPNAPDLRVLARGLRGRFMSCLFLALVRLLADADPQKRPIRSAE